MSVKTIILLAGLPLTLGALLLTWRIFLLGRRAKEPVAGSGLIGLRGCAETTINADGAVFVRGELWPAASHTYIAPGAEVRVVGLRGLAIEVEPE